MFKKELIKRAIDANGLTSAGAEGTAINPNIWDRRLREFEEANLVFTNLAEEFDLRGPGADLKVTIDDAPSAAAALVETDDVSITTFSTRNVTFTPSEYGGAYQVSDKEMRRAFFNVMDRMTRKLGYSMALKKDSVGIAAARTAAGTTILANNVAAATDLASTDTLGYEEIIDAARAIENNNYVPRDIVINNYQKAQLLKLDKVNKANEFGTRDAVARGLVGELFGLNIYATTQITNETSGATDTAKALVLGVSGTGERAMGYAVKHDPTVETEYHARGRYHDIVGVEEYDWQALHTGAIAIIQTYSA